MHCQMWKPPLLIIKEKNTIHADEKELCHVTCERERESLLTSLGHGQTFLKGRSTFIGTGPKVKTTFLYLIFKYIFFNYIRSF
jgi:hypothetical protein